MLRESPASSNALDTRGELGGLDLDGEMSATQRWVNIMEVSGHFRASPQPPEPDVMTIHPSSAPPRYPGHPLHAGDPTSIQGPGYLGPQVSGPRVLGTLSIVAGSLAGLGGLMGFCGSLVAGLGSGILSGFFQRGMGPPGTIALTRITELMSRAYLAYGVQAAIVLTMSVWLIVLGVGQRRYRRWATRQTIVWSVVAVVVLVLMVCLSVLVIVPATDGVLSMVRALGVEHISPLQAHFGHGRWITFGGRKSAIIMVLLYAPYPFLLLSYFTRRETKAVMTR